MAMDEQTKKTLLYGGGALASIVGLIYLMKKSASSGTTSVTPATPGSAAGAASNSALDAARLNAATNLAIETGREAVARDQIAASVAVAGINANSQASIAASNNASRTAQSAFGALGGSNGPAATATKGLFDLIKDLFSGNTGLKDTSKSAQYGPAEYSNDPSSGNYVPPGAYDPQGNPTGFADPTTGLIPDVVVKQSDYFQGSTGSGDTSWFGTSPGEESPGYGSYDPNVFNPDAGDAGETFV